MSDYNIDPVPVERTWKTGGRLEGVEECVGRRVSEREELEWRSAAPVTRG